MIKGAGRMGDKPLLVVGLTEENLEALPQDYPILIGTEQLGLPPMMVLIVAGKTDVEVRAMLEGAGLPTPPPLDERSGTVAKLDQERAEFRAVIEDLWGCIGAKEIEHLQPETVEFAKANHLVVSH